jgi:pyridinium-3,5-biscarboxylic acid mononucleotide sulfurtransferase
LYENEGVTESVASGSLGPKVRSDAISPPGSIGALREVIREARRMVVAFSGGVDSALVAWVARDVLGREASLAVTAVSPSLAPSELLDCRSMAEEWDLRWVEVTTDEGSRPDYIANGTDRCYHCKSELMDQVTPIASAAQAVVALGVNLDDLSDHRPGQRAAAEAGAVFPLVEAGFSKAAVRIAARELGLRIWDKPAGACLASRVPYGTPVTLSTLSRVATAEEGLRVLGFRELRVRHYGDVARLEFGGGEMAAAFASRHEVVQAVKAAGYRYVTLDLDGFRSGNLNDGAVAR